jgi:uncharacterized Zn-finger protein
MSNTAGAAQDATEVEDAVVACDGEGALGPPRVFLNFGAKTDMDCPYCGRRFVRKAGADSRPH